MVNFLYYKTYTSNIHIDRSNSVDNNTCFFFYVITKQHQEKKQNPKISINKCVD